jgi:predicted glycogen debranching enzyme
MEFTDAMIRIEDAICRDFEAATGREWLETNGIGGFASGTVSGANSRRYHGLLTPATNPPLGRVTMLSKFEETIVIDGERFELSSNRFPGAIHPQGFRNLKEFRLDPFPVWVYEVAGVSLEKRVFMVHGENATVCTWRITGAVAGGTCEIELRPLLAFCDYHQLQHETDRFDGSFRESDGLLAVRPLPDLPELFFAHNAVSVAPTGHWYRDFEYSIELERGFDFREDLFQPFSLRFDLARPAAVIVSTERGRAADDAAALERSERSRRRGLVAASGAKTGFAKRLVLAADQFIVSRGAGKTVIAGYPWFSDWGRDTMIALPGLTLATNRAEIARDILLEFSKHFSQGMIPNRFPDVGEEAEYNTVDATLWYFEAVRAYIEKTGDLDFVRDNLYLKMAESIAWHLRGTRYGIGVDTDGLLRAGTEGVQLTWMDAKIGDWVVTPRIGKPVEIQALWYNALLVMADLADRFGDAEDKSRYESLADSARLSFNAVFWNEAEDCLYDVVINGKRDGSVRPNQIFAVSLRHSMLSVGRAQKVVEAVERRLLTPVGLRSLAPGDPEYRPIYTGSPFERDSAYHQGTVWAWPIGAFVDAVRRVNPNGNRTEQRVRAILGGFERHLSEAGLGQISEIFDADAPHAPRGCFAQAWSVSEVLRVLLN